MARAGDRLRSQTCTTEVVVVRAPDDGPEIYCGGLPAVALDAAAQSLLEPGPGHNEGTQVGKRYVDSEGRFEVLCVKAGAGSLSVDGVVLEMKASKPLPASD